MVGRTFPLLMITLAASSGSAVTQVPAWIYRANAGPSARRLPAIANDTTRGRVVLFGGEDLNGKRADTWEWDGTSWAQRNPPASPSARLYPAIAYDDARQRVVLFGGTNGTVESSDTWEWDGSNWTQRSPTTSPVSRSASYMAFDSTRGRVVLFGGSAATGWLSDTWEWDGMTWLNRTSATSPSARQGHQMAYDASRQRVVLFGGRDYSLNGFPNDTWEWDGNSWIRSTPLTNPVGRTCHTMAYDYARQRVILFGGRDANTAVLADTWEWDGSSWTRRMPLTNPTARDQHAMTYDSARGRIVLFGGRDFSANVYFGDTWEYAALVPAAFTPYGNGCVGTAGVPLLTAEGGSLPYLQATFSLRLSSLPTSFLSSPFLILGASNTYWSGLTLPVDLAFIGMPGCSLLAGADVNLTLANLGGYARADLVIPSNYALVGATFYAQGVVLDRAANLMGATVTNAGAARIGAR